MTSTDKTLNTSNNPYQNYDPQINDYPLIPKDKNISELELKECSSLQEAIAGVFVDRKRFNADNVKEVTSLINRIKKIQEGDLSPTFKSSLLIVVRILSAFEGYVNLFTDSKKHIEYTSLYDKFGIDMAVSLVLKRLENPAVKLAELRAREADKKAKSEAQGEAEKKMAHASQEELQLQLQKTAIPLTDENGKTTGKLDLNSFFDVIRKDVLRNKKSYIYSTSHTYSSSHGYPSKERTMKKTEYFITFRLGASERIFQIEATQQGYKLTQFKNLMGKFLEKLTHKCVEYDKDDLLSGVIVPGSNSMEDVLKFLNIHPNTLAKSVSLPSDDLYDKDAGDKKE